MKKLIFDEIYDVQVERIVWRRDRNIILHALCRGRPVEEITEYVGWSVSAIQNIANNLNAAICELVCENIISAKNGAKLLRITEEELEGMIKSEGYLD